MSAHCLTFFVSHVRMCGADEDAVQAETFVSRASLITHELQDPKLKLNFKSMHTRIQDAKRKVCVSRTPPPQRSSLLIMRMYAYYATSESGSSSLLLPSFLSHVCGSCTAPSEDGII